MMTRGPMKQTTRKIHLDRSKNDRTHHLSLSKYTGITIQCWQNVLVWYNRSETKQEPQWHHDTLPYKCLLDLKGKGFVLPWRWGDLLRSIVSLWHNRSHVGSQCEQSELLALPLRTYKVLIKYDLEEVSVILFLIWRDNYVVTQKTREMNVQRATGVKSTKTEIPAPNCNKTYIQVIAISNYFLVLYDLNLHRQATPKFRLAIFCLHRQQDFVKN